MISAKLTNNEIFFMTSFHSLAKKYFSDRFFLILVCASVLLIGSSSVSFIIAIPKTDEMVYLHYTIYFGIDFIGSWLKLFWIPASGLGILILNTISAIFLVDDHRLLSSFLTISSFFYQLALFGGTILIILQNIT